MDTIFDLSKNIEITPFVIQAKRTPNLPQVVNTSLSGLAYVQVTGTIYYTTEVSFVIHKTMDSELLSAWKTGSLIKVVDGDITLQGYITSVELDTELADGYHKGSIDLQEDPLT